MKILFLTPQLPYPAVSGGLFKTSKMLEHFSNNHEVSFGCFLKENDAKNLAAFGKTISLNNKFHLPMNRGRSGLNFLISLVKNIPLSVYRNQSCEFQNWVNKEAKTTDVLFVDHFLMFQYVPRWFKGKVIFHQHNAEYVMWSRFADENKSLKKLILKIEALRIRKFEQEALSRSTVVFAAPNDIVELKKISPGNHYKVTYHLGDDSLLSEPYVAFQERENYLLYIGTLTWEANRNGLKWFLDSMWESVLNKNPRLKLIIIGKRVEGDFEQWLNHPSIEWNGFVDDLNPYYSKAKIFISPLKFGSGIKVKNINAMYRGLPLVTTSIGVEGLSVVKDQHVKIADSESEFVQSITELLTNEEQWKNMANESRHYAKTHFSWATLLNDIEQEVVK